MPTRPKAVLFDSFQTLFSLDALVPRLEQVGMRSTQLAPWYARALRDSCALAAAGTYAPFADVAAAALKGLGDDMGTRVSAERVAVVMGGMRDLRPVDDVRPAFEKLKAAGVAVALYSQGSRALMAHLVEQARLTPLVDHVISCDDVRQLKPLAGGYHHACEVAGHAPTDVALVAAHSWDCHGAARAGLTTGWVRRQEMHFNPVMGRPDVQGDHLVQVTNRLLAL